jgi:hypothetical protein
MGAKAPQGLKPSQKRAGFIAVLEALRHPRAHYSEASLSSIDQEHHPV